MPHQASIKSKLQTVNRVRQRKRNLISLERWRISLLFYFAGFIPHFAGFKTGRFAD